MLEAEIPAPIIGSGNNFSILDNCLAEYKRHQCMVLLKERSLGFLIIDKMIAMQRFQGI